MYVMLCMYAEPRTLTFLEPGTYLSAELQLDWCLLHSRTLVCVQYPTQAPKQDEGWPLGPLLSVSCWTHRLFQDLRAVLPGLHCWNGRQEARVGLHRWGWGRVQATLLCRLFPHPCVCFSSGRGDRMLSSIL